MNNELLILSITAASIGFFHTIIGPDHYLPFIVMSKARKWSLFKTLGITFFCGIGHILSSVILGIIGIIFGMAVMKLEAFEGVRGNLAAWALIGFGFMYFVWGIHSALRNKPHKHIHSHDGSIHSHEHSHTNEHTHVHDGSSKSITVWILFTIFILGPCEPLIPILMYPASQKSIMGIVAVTFIFGLVTIVTMLSAVLVLSWGINLLPFGKFEKFSHAFAGAAICLSGLTIQFLGL